ncbi:hypothetical protein CK203_094368 [Vitis vinifera]|uniref:DUF4283 domain-containing protein n=1 Tax=Vitis vinifera TaxID=29760 RepID=A0A438CW72_VITVI|nr:hypothetical protein CK203_094368 [Vitis vinifera]
MFSRAENRRKRKTRSFGVESKSFELEMEERRGKTLITITESKKGVSSWVRMGMFSVGLFMEGLHQCIEDVNEGRWEKGWKEKGRNFSLYLYSEGQRRQGGWSAMVEALYQLDNSIINKEKQEEMRVRGRQCTEMTKGRSFADAVKGETLETLGGEMAKAWGLKGKMGMASMGKGRVLLEFEFVEEARRVNLSGIRAVRGVQMGLECWDPNSGCLEEGETRKEVWVRILGLPMSLWVPSVLRRVGDACGGFLDVDPQTESLEELHWARVLVRSDGETFPDTLELGIEETTYSVTLWWERMPSIRTEEGRKQSLWNPTTREVEGDEASRAATRDMGPSVKRAQTRVGSPQGPGLKSGLTASGLLWAYGPKLPPASEAPKGDQSGPRHSNRLGRGAGYGMGQTHKGKSNLAQTHLSDIGLLLKTPSSCSNGHFKADDLEKEFTRCREEEMGRRQQLDPNNPSAERMLEEEAARYVSEINMGGTRAQGSSSSNLLCFGRTPEREYYDHSGGEEREFWLEVGREDQIQKIIQEEGMAVGTWLKSAAMTLRVGIWGGLQTSGLVKRAERKTSSIGRKVA